jgi:glycerol-3-phosphate acyltransferase PlsY
MGWGIVLCGYLLGTVQTGVLLVRLTRGADVRAVGSGRTGTTNVLRAAGKGVALTVLALDALKGLAPVLAARALTDEPWVPPAAGLAAVAGHVLPAFSRLRGGRGVATGIGAAAGLTPLALAAGLGVFIPMVALTRYVSLGSMLAATSVAVLFTVLVALGWEHPASMVFGVGAPALVVAAHHDNIARLVRGTERRLGSRPRA